MKFNSKVLAIAAVFAFVLLLPDIMVAAHGAPNHMSKAEWRGIVHGESRPMIERACGCTGTELTHTVGKDGHLRTLVHYAQFGWVTYREWYTGPSLHSDHAVRMMWTGNGHVYVRR